MISQELKDQIDKESRTYLNEGNRKTYVIAATKYAEYKAQLEEKKDKLFDDLLAENVKILEDVNYYKAISDRATKYAEKLEEKDKIIESKEIELTVWKDTADKFKRLVEEKDKAYNELGVKFDKEVERWQERDANEFEKRRVLESEIERLKYDLDASVKALVETCKKQDRELAQLKEIAEKMINYLKDIERCGECHYCSENAGCAIITYAEWCKQIK